MASNIAATSAGRLSRSARAIKPTLWCSQQGGAFPGLIEDVLGQEGEDGLVPDARVARGQDPVVLVGEVEELRLRATAGQVPPEPQRLGDRYPVVLVPVNHQHRRADLADVQMR